MLASQVISSHSRQRGTHPVTELHHLSYDLLIDAGEDGVSDELHVFACELVHKHLGHRGKADVI